MGANWRAAGVTAGFRSLVRRIRDRLLGRSAEEYDEATPSESVVLPGLYINGHFPSSELRLTGRIEGTSKKKGTFLDVRHNERSYFRRDGRWHRVFRAFHRPNRLGLPLEPWYAEVVLDEATGEVVHSNSEPLARHTGHGSDKSGTSPTASEDNA